MNNIFDQFDEKPEPNVFDQFDNADSSTQAPAVQQRPKDEITRDIALAQANGDFDTVNSLIQELKPYTDKERAKAAEFAKGIPGAIPTVLSGAAAEPIAGIAGIAQAVNPLAEKGAGARAVEATRDALTIDPIGDKARQTLQDTGEFLEPLSSIPSNAGQATLDATGSPLAATAVETGLSAIPELLGLKGGKALKGEASKLIPVDEASQIAEAKKAAEATGIDLFEGQQTLSAPALERQSFVAQLPAGVKKASAELKRQNIQASDAVDNVLSAIAPDDSIVVGQERFRSAAQRAIEAKKLAREEAASPIYKKAFLEFRQSGDSVDIGGIKDEFLEIAEDFPETGELKRTINKALGFMETGDLKKLHNAKIEIDQLIEGRGENSLGNTSKRNLVMLQKDLVEALENASPLYAEAKAVFTENSPPLTAIRESIIGKIANLDDTQLKSISTKIFDPQQVNVKAVTNAKKIISEVDPEAWNMLVRSEIERRMGSLKPDLGGAVENIPGKLANAIFGNGKQTDVLLAGVDGATKASLKSLHTALRRAGLGRNTGSQTASRAEISNELRGGKVSWVRDLFRRPIDTIVRTGEDTAFDNRVSAMTDALFDPKYKAETSQLISTGKNKELIRLILSIEALKASASQGISSEQQEEPQPQ